MAKNASDDLTYYLVIDSVHKSDLARIRVWANLKVGFNDNEIWVKDFDYAQINSVEVKSIPYKKIFYGRQNQLFFLDSRLPEHVIPSLLWTPIDRALAITLPSFNHNYFGIHENISMRLVRRIEETDVVAMVTSVDVVKEYIATAPAVRLDRIRWTIIDGEKIFLLGKPLLPISGETYWQRMDFLLPAGFDFEFFLLTEVVHKKINPARDHWIIWNEGNFYSRIPKESLQPLTLGSFRLNTIKAG